MIKARNIIVGCLVFLTISSQSFSQPIFTNPFGGSYFQPNFGFSANTMFNLEDFILDFGLGYEEIGYDYTISINGSFRPYFKTGLLEVSDHYYYQVQERVVQFSIDLEKRFYILQFLNDDKFGFYASLKSGFFWGNYKGFSKIKNTQFVANPGAGLSWQFSDICRVSAGYLHFNQNSFAPPGMIQLKFSIWMGKSKDS